MQPIESYNVTRRALDVEDYTVDGSEPRAVHGARTWPSARQRATELYTHPGFQRNTAIWLSAVKEPGTGLHGIEPLAPTAHPHNL